VTEAIEPIDLLAIILALPVLIGCANCLWIGLPPAMLLGINVGPRTWAWTPVDICVG
jgi:hypothetical protein